MKKETGTNKQTDKLNFAEVIHIGLLNIANF